MILDSVGDESASVAAKLAEKIIPEHWHEGHAEGQLAVDVLETAHDIVVISTMAGAITEEIEVYIHNDLLTIRGARKRPIPSESLQTAYHQECFWGAFSRTIVLPIDGKGDMAKAEYKNGVLTITIPKALEQTRRVAVEVVDE